MQPRDRRIYRITLAGSIVNIVLLVFKFIAGILGHSAAMIADAIHSLSDFLTDIIVIVFVRLSSKPADHDHDYGHGKYETLATSVIGMALAVVAVMLGWDGIEIYYPFILSAILHASSHVLQYTSCRETSSNLQASLLFGLPY